VSPRPQEYPRHSHPLVAKGADRRHLFAGRCLEPHRRARLGRKLLAIALYCPLDRAQAGDDAFLGCQLVADHVGIAVVPPQALLEPGLLAIERLFALPSQCTARPAGASSTHEFHGFLDQHGLKRAVPQRIDDQRNSDLPLLMKVASTIVG
jgi:DNA-binding transcriptional LysR family regulator